jgi:tetratricopeptide (TPR) repeat protein
VTSTATPTGADADALAALQEERDFLLRSLDDLEREHDAGDVDDTDYETLRDDYTARAAVVIRAIDAEQAATEAAPPKRAWGRTLGWVVTIVVFAVLAGLLVARMSGTRRDSDSATGDVRENTRQLLIDARSAFDDRNFDEAIGRYDDVLDLSPSNAEALAWRGWARFLANDGQDADAVADLDAAIAADPTLPEAHVFRASTMVEAGDFAGAHEQLEAFDALDPPPFMLQVVADEALRERIVAGVLLAEGAPTYTEAGFTAEEVLAAARYASRSVPIEALGMLDQLLVADPQNADAHADRGYILGRVAEQSDDDKDELGSRALADIDAALAIDPQHPGALAYRAFTLMYVFEDPAGAKAALDQFDALSDKPADVVALVEGSDLRDDVAG